MKLTNEELEMFKALGTSKVGETLSSYLERLSVHIKSVDTMGPDDTVESVKRAAKIIEDHIASKIKTPKKQEKGVGQEYE